MPATSPSDTPRTIAEMRVDWPAPDHVPEHLKVDLAWASGSLPNNLVDTFEPAGWLSGPDVPPLLYQPLSPDGRIGSGGMVSSGWVVSHYDDIDRVYSDNDYFSNAGTAEFQAVVGETFRTIPLAVDPPDHRKYRMFLMPYFSPSRLNRMQDSIRATVAEMIEGFAARGEVDIAWDFGRVYPVRVFMDLMKFPPEMFEQFLDWEWSILHSGDMDQIKSALTSILAYLRAFMAEKERRPDDSLTSAIVNGRIEGRPLTDEEKIGIVWLLWLGGLDTVAASIALMFRRMALEPAIQRELAADRSLIPGAVEEFLRVHPVVSSSRHARQDFVWHGIQIRKGDSVRCNNAAGNYDPARFPDPRRFDPRRHANRHFTFVAGVHICLGAALARRELRILLEEWFARMPEFGPKPGSDTTCYPGLLSARHLHISWDAARVRWPSDQAEAAE